MLLSIILLWTGQLESKLNILRGIWKYLLNFVVTHNTYYFKLHRSFLIFDIYNLLRGIGGLLNANVSIQRLVGEMLTNANKGTLEFLINVQHVYLIFIDFSFLNSLIRNYKFINFDDLFLPTLLFGTKTKPQHENQSLKNE